MLALAGCEDMQGMRKSISDFDQGAHVTADAQTHFYAVGRKLECDAAFYAAVVPWTKDAHQPLPSPADCTPAVLDDTTLAKRKALLDALLLYADKLSELTGPKDASPLGDAEKSMAGDINAMAQTAKLTPDTAVAGAVEAAVIAITNFVLDRTRFRDARAAAAELDGQIATIVATLKIENLDYAAALNSSTARIQLTLHQMLADESAANRQSFFDAITARDILRDASPFGPVTPAILANRTPPPAIVRLNAALDQLQKANHEIADGPPATAKTAVINLISRAKQAKDDQAALSQ